MSERHIVVDDGHKDFKHNKEKWPFFAPPNVVVIAKGYSQRLGEEGRGKYCLRYHLYLILEELKLKNAIAFANGTGLYIAP